MASATQVIHEAWEGTLSGELKFPQVVQKLQSVQVQRYHVDFVAKQKTSYLPDNKVDQVDKIPEFGKPVWDATAVKAALVAVQRGETSYQEFCRAMLLAGVTNYWVYIEGMRVVYLGANGDMHTEWFPGAKP